MLVVTDNALKKNLNKPFRFLLVQRIRLFNLEMMKSNLIPVSLSGAGGLQCGS